MKKSLFVCIEYVVRGSGILNEYISIITIHFVISYSRNRHSVIKYIKVCFKKKYFKLTSICVNGGAMIGDRTLKMFNIVIIAPLDFLNKSQNYNDTKPYLGI